jgi:hypothetical protein
MAIRKIVMTLTLTVSTAMTFGATQQEPCPIVLSTMSWQSALGLAETDPERVEIRRCNPKDLLGSLQIVAWEKGSRNPSLLVGTSDVTITQTFSAAGIVVLQTGHETTDSIRVIAFQSGKPKMLLDDYVKTTVSITGRERGVAIEFRDAAGKLRHYDIDAQSATMRQRRAQ